MFNLQLPLETGTFWTSTVISGHRYTVMTDITFMWRSYLVPVQLNNLFCFVHKFRRFHVIFSTYLIIFGKYCLSNIASEKTNPIASKNIFIITVPKFIDVRELFIEVTLKMSNMGILQFIKYFWRNSSMMWRKLCKK